MKYVFDVSNMKCAGCVSAVKASLVDLKETKVIEVNLEQHQAIVQSSKSGQEIADVINAAGYPAKLHKTLEP